MLAIGAYPIQKDYRMIEHTFASLSGYQTHMFADYNLTRGLPNIAQKLS